MTGYLVLHVMFGQKACGIEKTECSVIIVSCVKIVALVHLYSFAWTELVVQ